MKFVVNTKSVNYSKIIFIFMLSALVIWSLPFMFGKYPDSTFPYIEAGDIIQELVGLVGQPREGLHWCPAISHFIQNKNKLLNNNVPVIDETSLVEKFGIEVGGVGRPKDCQSRYQVAIIVPYRNRTFQLNQFLSYMHPFLIRQQLDYRIIVVEQAGKGEFNRAKLFNIGFTEGLKLGIVDCLIFHDVDLLPRNDFNIYACTHNPRHMYSALDTFRYHLIYRRLFGGATAVQRSYFMAINGFSNKYYGWGGEDDDFYNRFEKKNLSIVRFDPSVASYVMLHHRRRAPSPERWKHLAASKKLSSNDGLSDLDYELLDIKLLPLYTWVMVRC